MKRLRDQRGITLTELLVAMVVLGLLLVGIYNTFQAQERAYIVQDQMAETNQRVRVALEIMSRDIRNAGYDPEKSANARIQTATATSIVFTQDLDEDGTLNSNREWLGYRYDAANDQIEQCSGSDNCTVWQPFVDAIETFQLNYIYADGESSAAVGLPDDADADDTNDLDDIRVVEMQIEGRPQKAQASQFERILTSQVKVRNLALMR